MSADVGAEEPVRQRCRGSAPDPAPQTPEGLCPADAVSRGGMRVVGFAEADVPAALAGQVAALEAAAWPGSSPGHDPALAPRVMLLADGAGTVAAALALLHKDVVVADRTYRAAGLSGVVTRAELRGRGFGGRLVAAARTALAAEGAVDLALFSCDRPLAPFYAAAGFPELPGTVLVGGTPGEPLATDGPGFDKAVVAAFFTAAPEADRAAFTGVRVPLYPGTTDRLW